MEKTTVKTPLGNDVVFKEYLTTKDRNKIRGVYLKSAKVNVSEQTIEDYDMTSVDVTERILIECAVLEYRGSSEQIYERLLEERPEDYDFIVGEANKLYTGNLKKAK